MRWLALTCALLAGCAWRSPVKVQVSPPVGFNNTDRARWFYAGSPLKTHISWICDRNTRGCCDSFTCTGCDGATCDALVADIRVRCSGTPCRVEGVERPPPPRDSRNRTSVVVPEAPGTLIIEHQVTLASGHRTAHRIRGEVLPRPVIIFTCKIRDPVSGAYVRCPPSIPAGTEVHATAEVDLGSDRRPHPPSIHLDIMPVGQDSAHDAKCGFERDGSLRIKRCIWRAVEGRARLRLRLANIVEQIPIGVTGAAEVRAR
jgi:hypothetical protein